MKKQYRMTDVCVCSLDVYASFVLSDVKHNAQVWVWAFAGDRPSAVNNLTTARPPVRIHTPQCTDMQRYLKIISCAGSACWS